MDRVRQAPDPGTSIEGVYGLQKTFDKRPFEKAYIAYSPCTTLHTLQPV